MKIGEHQLVFADEVVLLFYGLLHFHDHFRDRENTGCIGKKFGAGGDVLFVAEAAADTGGGLYMYGVTALHQFLCAGGCEGNTVFIIFNFLRNSDDHPLRVSSDSGLPQALRGTAPGFVVHAPLLFDAPH